MKPGAILRVECDDWTGGQIKNGDSANDICETCGPFERHRSLNEAGDPMACPTCLSVAQRVYSTLAHILTSAALRRGLEQQAEPKVVKRPTPNDLHLPKSSTSQLRVDCGNSAMRCRQGKLIPDDNECRAPSGVIRLKKASEPRGRSPYRPGPSANGSGTGHGSGEVAFVIGEAVGGGIRRQPIWASPCFNRHGTGRLGDGEPQYGSGTRPMALRGNR